MPHYPIYGRYQPLYRAKAKPPAEPVECNEVFDCSTAGACGVVSVERCPLSRWREVADQLDAHVAAFPRANLD